MLITELNILNKAKIYIDNEYSLNPVKLTEDFERAYRLWQFRQYEINPFIDKNLGKHYTLDYSYDKDMYREISEDLLYVQLNLLLAIKISTYLNNNYINSENTFDLVIFIVNIQELIDEHLKEHDKAYSCLQCLRELNVKKFNTEHLEYYILNTLKGDVEYKKANLSKIINILDKFNNV